MKLEIYNSTYTIFDLIVTSILIRCYESYCIFRPDGKEIEVRFINDKIDCDVELTE